MTADFFAMVLVGALWGCTNPLLRKGAVESETTEPEKAPGASSSLPSSSFSLMTTLRSFGNIRVWLPYVLNQSGSLVYYALLSQSDLSLAVPTCNALALVFSFATSYWLTGEHIEKPLQTAVGASLILIGVTICVSGAESNDDHTTGGNIPGCADVAVADDPSSVDGSSDL